MRPRMDIGFVPSVDETKFRGVVHCWDSDDTDNEEYDVWWYSETVYDTETEAMEAALQIANVWRLVWKGFGYEFSEVGVN